LADNAEAVQQRSDFTLVDIARDVHTIVLPWSWCCQWDL